MKGIIVLLITVTLFAGMVGCGGDGVEYDISISSSTGGSVITPGEGTFTYDEGAVVNLVAEAEEGYYFVKWTGDVDTVDHADAAETIITMNDNYSITANFVPDGAEPVWDWYDLDAVRNNLGGSYILMNDLDLTTDGYTELASPTANNGTGWQPIGEFEEPFTGLFDGQGYEIRDLLIDRPDEGVGLFRGIGVAGVVINLGLANANVTGYRVVGSLAGSNMGNVTDCYATGSVTGERHVGGLVGASSYPELDPLTQGTLSNCYATSNVTGVYWVGGLAGIAFGTVTNCYAIGKVTGMECVGGLVAITYNNTVTDCYATGSVTGTNMIGGLVGMSYGNISNSYSIGSVTGSIYTGGLVAYNEGAVTNSFWDTETSGQATSDGGTGKTTAQMQDITTFTDTETEGLDESWDIVGVANPDVRNFAYIWNIVDDETYPFLSWQPVS